MLPLVECVYLEKAYYLTIENFGWLEVWKRKSTSR